MNEKTLRLLNDAKGHNTTQNRNSIRFYLRYTLRIIQGPVVTNSTFMDIMHSLYRAAKPLIFKLSPDNAHAVFLFMGEIMGSNPLTRALIASLYEYHGADISKTVNGVTYQTPVLLSAGFDSDGRLTRILRHLSFGGEEIGSITAYPCEGNPLPRMTRLIRNKSMIVYKGLRNNGVDALITRLKKTPHTPGFVIGISIARTNRKESCTNTEEGINDFALSFQKLNDANIGDYYTINISCPNAFAGEAFTSPEPLTKLLTRLETIPCTKPIYLKMPIHLPTPEFDALLRIADKFRIHGVICGNLNKNYNELDFPEDAPKEFRGGLSGKPCFLRSNALIRYTREHFGDRFTIIGTGGILSPEDAMEKFRSGADIVQMISGMIFTSPSLMKQICKKYAEERPMFLPKK